MYRTLRVTAFVVQCPVSVPTASTLPSKSNLYTKCSSGLITKNKNFHPISSKSVPYTYGNNSDYKPLR